jgi:hypothetical protein
MIFSTERMWNSSQVYQCLTALHSLDQAVVVFCDIETMKVARLLCRSDFREINLDEPVQVLSIGWR